jgi:hypothetical protein
VRVGINIRILTKLSVKRRPQGRFSNFPPILRINLCLNRKIRSKAVNFDQGPFFSYNSNGIWLDERGERDGAT